MPENTLKKILKFCESPVSKRLPQARKDRWAP
jgi:hypothetical protein